MVDSDSKRKMMEELSKKSFGSENEQKAAEKAAETVLKLEEKLRQGARVRGIQMVKEPSSSYSLPLGPVLRGLSKTTGYTETQVMSMKCKIVL